MHCGVCKIVFTCRQAESLSCASLAPVHSAKLEGLDLNVLKWSPLINSRLGNEDLLYVKNSEPLLSANTMVVPSNAGSVTMTYLVLKSPVPLMPKLSLLP